MKNFSHLCLAALILLVPMRLVNANVQTRSGVHGTPTMAYYTKGRIIYYGFTDYTKSYLSYSSILATNPAYARLHYQNPTMAYYAKDRVIYYAYTKDLPWQSSKAPNWNGFIQPEQSLAGSPREAISLVRTTSGEPVQAPPSIQMRTSPVSNREAFEKEAEQTKGTMEENIAALQSSPADAASFYKRANAYKDTNDYWKAIQDYGEVIKFEPENPYAYFKRGLCYSAINQLDLANENFRRANEIISGQDKPWSQKSRSWYPQSGY
ncbi:MAG: tetratricopeptide repeat protein [Verrucomicrobiota bacterium]